MPFCFMVGDKIQSSNNKVYEKNKETCGLCFLKSSICFHAALVGRAALTDGPNFPSRETRIAKF